MNETIGAKRHDWQGFQELCWRFFENEAGRSFVSEMTLELASGPHRFDLVCIEGGIVVECKSYTWTKSGNRPSAKWEAAQRACSLLAEAPMQRKTLVFQDHVFGANSLAKEFMRLNEHPLRNIEVWRLYEGSFEKLKEVAP